LDVIGEIKPGSSGKHKNDGKRGKLFEASEDLQMGGILSPKFRGKLFEDENLKTKENRRLGPRNRYDAPRAWTNALGMKFTSYVPSASSMRQGNAMRYTHMRLGCFACAPCMQKLGTQLSFLASVLGKALTFSPNSGRNSHYKY